MIKVFRKYKTSDECFETEGRKQKKNKKQDKSKLKSKKKNLEKRNLIQQTVLETRH